MTEICLLLITLLPIDQEIEEHVDRIELNHFYSGDGKLVFDQVIFWDWNQSLARYEIRDWRLIKDCRYVDDTRKQQWDTEHPDGPPYVPESRPVHAWPRSRSGRPLCDWFDEKSHKPRRVTADVLIESWTDFDPELIDREKLPQENRRGLR